jgi:hypothetical protein
MQDELVDDDIDLQRLRELLVVARARRTIEPLRCEIADLD